jgi:two-component system, OmpR family, heavy metal sensor histidine kinase CusS
LLWRTKNNGAETRHGPPRAAQELIHAQYEVRCKEQTADLDRHLLIRAQTMAGLARTVTIHLERLYPFSALVGAAAFAQRDLPMRAWFVVSPIFVNGKEIPAFAYAKPREDPHIEDPDKLIADEDLEQGQEYFQSYRWNGLPLQQSKSMGAHRFTLDPAVLVSARLFEERFDSVELKPGVHLRRVTLKAPVSARGVPGSFRMPRFRPANRGSGLERPLPPRNLPTEWPTPTFFIQYASDTAPLQDHLAEIGRERDLHLAQVDSQTRQNLHQLRSRLFWISATTLTALWLGGILLVHLGLAPLARLADAVSRVSAKDFRLDIDSQKLPSELQPIAARLVLTLRQLGQVFEREKQAAADISHELRTPLAALMTTVEVALRKPRSLPEYQEILEECHLSGSHMAHLVERLLALARLDAGAVPYRPCEVDVAELAVQCADLVRPLARAKGLELRVDATPPLPLTTDPDKFREILTNLLHNAIEYNRDGGKIDIAVERVDGQVRLQVQDTGIGITAEVAPHIFERFYRADPSRHSDTPHAGLGLAIVKSYVDLMSGQIFVESDTHGSTFRVELPLT